MSSSQNRWPGALWPFWLACARRSTRLPALRFSGRLQSPPLHFRNCRLAACTIRAADVLFATNFEICRIIYESRKKRKPKAAYYLITLTLQLIPYILAGGAGVTIGLANFRPKTFYQGEKWLGIREEAIRYGIQERTLTSFSPIRRSPVRYAVPPNQRVDLGEGLHRFLGGR
jgi:hypothetical protein